MAGLCGYVALDEIELTEGSALLSRMLDGLAESGPVGRGTAVSGDFGLGVRRAPGTRLPHRSSRGDFALALDGAPRLGAAARARLWSPPEGFAPEGAFFEALRELHGRDEERLLEHLEGGFALALWDGRTRRMLLARDRFGEKALFFGWARGGRLLLFASEAKALLRSGRMEASIDERAVFDVLAAGAVGAGRTLFGGVRALLPGSWLSLDVVGREQQARWYEPPYPRRGAKPEGPREEAALSERLEAALGELPAQTAFDLTGAAPAAGLLAVLHRRAAGPAATFAPVFDDPGHWDDAPRLAERWAEAAEAEHAAVPLRPLDEEDALRVLRALELPPLDPAPFFLAQVYAAVAASGRRLVVAADGAEAICGDGPVGPGRSSSVSRLLRGFAGRFTLRRAPGLARALRSSWRLERSFRTRFGAAPVELERWVLQAHLADRLLARRHAPPRGLGRLPLELGPSPRLIESALHRRLRLHQSAVLAGRDLAWGDRLARASSLERRLPFLDSAVVDLTARTRGPPVGLLRSAVADALGPAAARRRRRPLRPPNAIWPFGPGTPTWVRRALGEGSLADLGLFEPQAVARALERLSVPPRGPADRLEARVLLGALGITLLARSVGASRLV